MIWDCVVITFVAAVAAGGMGFFAGIGVQRSEDFKKIRYLEKQIEAAKKNKGIQEIPTTKEIKYGGF